MKQYIRKSAQMEWMAANILHFFKGLSGSDSAPTYFSSKDADKESQVILTKALCVYREAERAEMTIQT